MSRWKDFKEPSRVPDHSILLFGCDPAHTPANEPRSPADCPRCSHLVDTVDDPVRDYECAVRDNGVMSGEPATAVCCCGRSAWDGTTALARAKKRRLEGAPDDDTDRRDAQNRTAEAVSRGAGGKSKGRVEYKDKMAYADHMARLRQKRKVQK